MYNNKPFGTTSTFGTATQNTFGQRPAAPNVFGASTFGTTQPAAPVGTNLFGGGFGQAASSTGMQQQPQLGTGLFGSTSQVGAPTTTSLFGAPASTGAAFGISRPTGFGGFGTGSGSTLFSAQPSAQQATPLFGQTAPTGTATLFGAGGFSSTQSGTTIKFNPLTGTDTMMKNGTSTNIHTRHQCITCMKEYEHKSFEELRVEDYAANRKGSTTAMPFSGAGTAQTGLFNQPSTSAFSFGASTSKPLFGATTQPSLTTGFGTQGSTLFGQPATSQQQTNLFNKPAFGATTTTSSFSFGNPVASTTGGFFGSTIQQPKVGSTLPSSQTLFGSSAPSGSLFGTSTTTTTPAFGSSQSVFGNTSNTFGAAANANPFGSRPSTFGAPASTMSGTSTAFSFGAPNQSTSLFGTRPSGPTFGAPAFGTTPTSFGNFSTAPTTQSSGLFGTKPFGTFGTGTSFGTAGGGGGTSFGTGAFGTTSTPSLFNTSTTNKPNFSFNNPSFNFGPTQTSYSLTGPNPTASFTPDLAAHLANKNQIQQHVLAFSNSPYGDSPLFRGIIKDNSNVERLKPTDPAAQRSILSSSSKPDLKVPPLRPQPAIKIKPALGKPGLFTGIEEERTPIEAERIFSPRQSVKKLALKKNPTQRTSLFSTNLSSPNDNESALASPQNTISSRPNLSFAPISTIATMMPISSSKTSDASPRLNTIQENSEESSLNLIQNNIVAPISSIGTEANSPTPPRLSSNLEKKTTETSSLNLIQNSIVSPISSITLNDTISDLNIRQHSGIMSPEIAKDGGYGINHSLEKSVDSEPGISPQGTATNGHPTGILLTRYGYYTYPPLDQLASLMDENGNCFVENFTIGREGYGNVIFPEKINVANLHLDEIVFFRRKEITLYPDDSKKPPIGTELNRKAQITLDCVWPADKTTREPITDPERLKNMRYAEKLEQSTIKLGAKFVEYRPETGSWVFSVQHFSKYGLRDSDDEDASVDVVNANSDVPISKPLLHLVPSPPIFTSTFSSFGPSVHEGTQTNGLSQPIGDIAMQDVSGKGAEESSISIDLEDFTASSFKPSSDKIDRMKMLFLENEEFLCDFSIASLVRSPSFHKEPVRITHSPALPPTALVTQVEPSKAEPTFTPLGTLGPARKLELVPLAYSKLYHRWKLLQDFGCYRGRSFRMGHAFNYYIAITLGPMLHTPRDYDQEAYSSSPFSSAFKHHLASRMSNPALVCLKAPAFCSQFLEASSNQKDYIMKLLEHNLNFSLKFSDNIEAPYFMPKPGNSSLETYVQIATKYWEELNEHDPDLAFASQFKLVFQLVKTLWGDLPQSKSLEEPSLYTQRMLRREALSSWLIEATKDKLDDEFKKSQSHAHGSEEYTSMIFNYLTCHQIEKAVQLAQKNKNHRLAMIISQAAYTDESRCLLRKQLNTWKELKSDYFIDKNKLLIYTLLAGCMVWQANTREINCCQGLDWKRAFAIHFWYHCKSNADIADALSTYEEAFMQSENKAAYALRPFPPYIEDNPHVFTHPILKNLNMKHYDTCFHLLKLYIDRHHRLDKTLCSTTSTPSEIDVRLSWFLHQALLALGYTMLSPELANKLHIDFAAQLNLIGLWHWAAYVLLHISDPQRRKAALLDQLYLYISLKEDKKVENFLCHQLGVPEPWLYKAKALKARSKGKSDLEAKFLLKAGEYSESHAVIVSSLAAEYIVNDRLGELKELLEPLSQPKVHPAIPLWNTSGKMYLDFINMTSLLDDLTQGNLANYDLERIEPIVVEIARKVCATRCDKPLERYCQSVMAQKMFLLLQIVIRFQATTVRKERLMETSLLHLLETTSLPEDCILQQLQNLVRTYMLKFTQ